AGVLIFLAFRSSHSDDGRNSGPARQLVRAPVAAAPAPASPKDVKTASPGGRIATPSATEPSVSFVAAEETGSAAVPMVTAKGDRTTKGKAKAKPKPLPAGAQPGASCDPPYSIDPDGIKHFKPECFK